MLLRVRPTYGLASLFEVSAGLVCMDGRVPPGLCPSPCSAATHSPVDRWRCAGWATGCLVLGYTVAAGAVSFGHCPPCVCMYWLLGIVHLLLLQVVHKPQGMCMLSTLKGTHQLWFKNLWYEMPRAILFLDLTPTTVYCCCALQIDRSG